MEKKVTTKLEATKATVKAAEGNATVKAEEKAVVKEATTAKETVKEAVAEVKKTVKKAAEKKTEKMTKKTVKEEMVPEVFIQFQGNEAVVADAIEKAKAQFVAEGHRASSIKSLQIYLKPEEGAAYYVINQKLAGRVDLF